MVNRCKMCEMTVSCNLEANNCVGRARKKLMQKVREKKKKKKLKETSGLSCSKMTTILPKSDEEICFDDGMDEIISRRVITCKTYRK